MSDKKIKEYLIQLLTWEYFFPVEKLKSIIKHFHNNNDMIQLANFLKEDDKKKLERFYEENNLSGELLTFTIKYCNALRKKKQSLEKGIATTGGLSKTSSGQLRKRCYFFLILLIHFAFFNIIITKLSLYHYLLVQYTLYTSNRFCSSHLLILLDIYQFVVLLV